MAQKPLPSELVLLSSLPSREIGDKVRFLGCVTEYSTAEGELMLGHLYPAGSNTIVSVDVGLLLGALKAEETQVGEWVNIIGYVTEKGDGNKDKDRYAAKVQAIVLWSAGPFDIQRYERSFGTPV